MKIRAADYIADFLVKNGIKDCFTVVGGGAMHLNDAFGHCKGLTCTYQHHEQACAIAAEAYARINNRPALLCVTTGPGGTNALTGVVGAYLDSIPMIVISGQVRYDTTARFSGLGIRAMGDQEFDICKCVESMTKYCEMITDPKKIRSALQKALHIATTGRMGPCWLDIPLNIQGGYIDDTDLEEYDPSEYDATLPGPVSDDTVSEIIDRIKRSARPVIYAGSAIRYSGAFDTFTSLVKKMNIPVVTAWNSIDEMTTDDPLYAGRAGIMGDRPGNFAVQNADLVLSLGCRLSIRQVGYNFTTWARNAYVIANDIDPEELKKPTLHIDMPVCADVKDLVEKLNAKCDNDKIDVNKKWIDTCLGWKKKYPVVTEKQKHQKGKANIYCFTDFMSSMLPENEITVVGNGSACVVGGQAYIIKKGQRFITNSAIASMGYDLPAAIGACISSGYKEVVNFTGDGSIQMNIQELQTIISHRLPIKIFVVNNDGYHSIRQTQSNFFKGKLVGIGSDSGDLSFPDMKKIAYAYGFPYYCAASNRSIKTAVRKTLATDGPVICEIFVDKNQRFEPKSATRRLDDGSLVSAPLEDLAPFLPEDELKKIMKVSD